MERDEVFKTPKAVQTLFSSNPRLLVCASWVIVGLLLIANKVYASTPEAYQRDLDKYENAYLRRADSNSLPTAQSLSPIIELILRGGDPFYIRVKYSVLFARICRKYGHLREFCSEISNELADSAEANGYGIALSNYIRNIGLSVVSDVGVTEVADVKVSPEPIAEPSNKTFGEAFGRFAPPKRQDRIMEEIMADRGGGPSRIVAETPAEKTLIKEFGGLGWPSAVVLSFLILVLGRALTRPAKRIVERAVIKRALVVDDDLFSLMFAKRLLLKLGYQVEAFQNPLAALKRAAVGRFDVMLLDYKMPEMDGDELAAAIDEKLEGQTHPRLFFLTGKSSNVELKTPQPKSFRYCGTMTKSTHPKKLEHWLSMASA